jgi:hypothetical protein
LFATTEVFLAFKAKGCAGLGEVGGGFSPEAGVSAVKRVVFVVATSEVEESVKDQDAVVHGVDVFSAWFASFGA